MAYLILVSLALATVPAYDLICLNGFTVYAINPGETGKDGLKHINQIPKSIVKACYQFPSIALTAALILQCKVRTSAFHFFGLPKAIPKTPQDSCFISERPEFPFLRLSLFLC